MKLTTTTALTLLSTTTTLARPHPTEERDIGGEAAWNDAPAATATSDVPVIAADKRQDDSWMSGWYEYNTATLLTGPTNVDIFGMPIAKRTDAPAASAVPAVPADKRDDNAWMSGWYEYNTATLLTGPTNVDIFGMPIAKRTNAPAASTVPAVPADKRQDDSWMSGWYEYNTATLLIGPTNVDIFGMPIAKRTDAPAVSAVPAVPADKRDDNAWMSGWYEYNTATLLTGPTNVDIFGMPKATKRAEAVEEKRDFHDSHGQNLRPANHEAPGLDPYGPQTTQNVGRVATMV